MFFLPINFLSAQTIKKSEPIKEPEPPQVLKCGPNNLPSVLKTTTLTTTQPIWKTCVMYYLTRGLSLLYRLAGVLGVIFLAWAGILYAVKPEKSSEIHQKLLWAVVGIVLAILSFTIVKMIDLFFFRL